MSLPTIFELCAPRADIQAGRIDSEFAADLAQVIKGTAPLEYSNPDKFFANTHPTRGLTRLLTAVCQRLTGNVDQFASIFRLDTNYGGGKTHSLIALYHVINNVADVANISEFVDPTLIPTGTARIAAFDGENSDPMNGRSMGDGVYAKTPWGEIAYGLAGKAGYDRVQSSDESGVAPGAETLRELFGSDPTLILLDEISIYLRKLKAKDRDRAGDQVTAFLTGLFKAVEASPNAALVFTLAIGKDGTATDAYSEENQFIAGVMEELASVSARKATLLDPTEEDETVKVLRRRLFEYINDEAAEAVIQAYQDQWQQHQDAIASTTPLTKRITEFKAGYPLHPELIETLRNKTATLNKFQRVRGMLRLLTRTVSELWQHQPKETHAIHLHHLDPGVQSIRQEITTRLDKDEFLPAIRSDVASGDESPALAQDLDQKHHKGLSPFCTMVARTILFHSLAYNEALKGLSLQQLQYSMLTPGVDPSFITQAVRHFVAESAYLDDRTNAPLRFQTEANLTQMIRQQEKLVSPDEVRVQLNDRIKEIFKGNHFLLDTFPGGPYEVADDTSDRKPHLVLISHGAAAVNSLNLTVPDLVERIYKEKGSSGDVRINRNNVIFLCVDVDRRKEMEQKMTYCLALRSMQRVDVAASLADYQRDKVRELEKRSQSEVAIAIQQAYRHVFYPSKNRVETAAVDLAHATLDIPSTSATPGRGQSYVANILRSTSGKLRLPEDNPDTPDYIRDKTLLRKQPCTTAKFRQEFYQNPALPILVGDDVFIKGITQGIQQNKFVYKSGDLLWGQGDPEATINIDENSYVYTVEQAKDANIWPRPLELEQETYGNGTPDTPNGGELIDGRGYDPDAPGSTGGNNPPLPPPRLEVQNFTAEGTLREALGQIWANARARQVALLGSLKIEIFDYADAFTLLGLLRSVKNVEIVAKLTGSYETQKGSTFECEFEGELDDIAVVKDFLSAQIRAAKDRYLTATASITFNNGLDLRGSDPETLVEKFSKLGAGAAHVTATAQAKPEESP